MPRRAASSHRLYPGGRAAAWHPSAADPACAFSGSIAKHESLVEPILGDVADRQADHAAQVAHPAGAERGVKAEFKAPENDRGGHAQQRILRADVGRRGDGREQRVQQGDTFIERAARRSWGGTPGTPRRGFRGRGRRSGRCSRARRRKCHEPRSGRWRLSGPPAFRRSTWAGPAG